MGPRLRIRLRSYHVDQLIGELRNIHQLRPRPGQRQPELRDEVLHACFAACNPVGLKKPHLSPAQPEAITNGIVNLLGRRHPVFDEPQRLAPNRLQKTVCDMGVNLLAYAQRMHADRSQNLGRPLDKCIIARGRGHHLHQGQQIHRVEGMGHHDLPGPRRALLQLRRLEA